MSIAYTVAVTFSNPGLAEDWLRWLTAGHIADVLAGGATDAEIIELAVFFGNQDHLNYFDVGMPRAAMRACTRLRLSGFWN